MILTIYCAIVTMLVIALMINAGVISLELSLISYFLGV